MTEFYLTRMGHRFYEHTMPALVAELAKLNANLERLATAVERPTEHPPDSGRDPDESEPKAKENQDA